MTGEQLWPSEAREAIKLAVCTELTRIDMFDHGDDDEDAITAAVLAALADHAVPKKAVLDLAQRWEDDDRLSSTWDCEHERHPEQCAVELRALTGGHQ